MHAKYVVGVLLPLRIENGFANNEQEQWVQQLVTAYGGELLEPFRRLDGFSEAQMIDIGFALCASPDAECGRYVGKGLFQAAALAKITFLDANDPALRREPYGLPPNEPRTCDPTVGHVRSPKWGVGFEWATGVQASAKPVDGRVGSIGLEGRARIGKRFGVVARLDRSSGRDESIDVDGDGRDDRSTGSVTRWTSMLGASIMLQTTRDRQLTRYWQWDSLVGLSRDGDRSGVLVGADLSYQLVVGRLGVRVLQGFGGAEHEKAALVHAGLSFGAGPEYAYGAGCDWVEGRPKGSAWALALDLPLSGYAHGVGYVTPGFGVEGAWHASEEVDLVLHGDLIAMPSGDRERALHQSVLGGARLDLGSGQGRGMRRGVVAAVMAGYDHVATTSSAAIQSGPVIDGSIGYAMQADDGAMFWRLHGRFGLTDANQELRAIFASFGVELRLDRRRWKDRRGSG